MTTRPTPFPATAGPVFRPGDDGYDGERAGYNQIVTHHPTAIVGAAGTADVRAAVRYAAAHELPIGIQATGHGVSVPADDAVLITTRRMNDVTIDADRRLATVQAGVRSNTAVSAAAPHGLAPLNGSAPDVGIVSYTLGGGLPLLGRRFGYAADHVKRIDIVTADGELHTTTASRDAELFWAARGGKGNFGVVVSMAIDLFPLAHVYGGGLWYAADDVDDLLRTYSGWTREQPEAMASSVLLVRLPDVDGVPDAIRGRYVAHVRIAYAGPTDAGLRLVQPLRDAAPRLLDTVMTMPYRAVGSIHNEPTRPVRFYATNGVLDDVDDHAVDTLLDEAGPDVRAPFFVELRHLGGALARPPVVPNAIGRRDGRFTAYTGAVVTPRTIDAVRDAMARFHDAMRPWATGGVCANFLSGPDTTTDELRTGFSAQDFERLRQVKRRYDPTNLFRINHNIPPADTAADPTFPSVHG